MSAVAQYLNDWNDACVYAKECLPDFGFLDPGEPYTALATIVGICYYVWRRNEKQIVNRSN